MNDVLYPYRTSERQKYIVLPDHICDLRRILISGISEAIMKKVFRSDQMRIRDFAVITLGQDAVVIEEFTAGKLFRYVNRN